LGRIDGSIGLAINKPHFQIIAEASNRTQIESVQYQGRAHSIVERLRAKYDFPGITLKFTSETPPHSGFGSGTQLALGIAQAVNTLYNLNLSVAELALAVGRGGTSGIGIVAYEQGGFILDGGHRFPEQKASFLPSSAAGNVPPPPLLLRHPFPDWNLLIVIPNCTHISGETEINLFKTLCPQPRAAAEQLSHIILLKLLPAIFEKDLYAFGDAINRIQTFGWKKVEIDAQGSVLQQTLDSLRNNGAIGAGVSSWGPAIFAVGEDIAALLEKTNAFLKTLPAGGTCFITQANNAGARVKEDIFL
ncbi:beta-ribofuranosylaminobenzene 5'-phosphate synthase, partial [Candidatus Poribacteria bacterium]|nr:beta-ribofuranosylaminobenzene 5'-phosphate synthase [Candidatus Poribacteria bacterium]